MTSLEPPRTPRAGLIVAALGVGASLGWGLAYVPSAWLMEQWHPFFAAGMRVAIAGAVLLAVMAVMGKSLAPGCSWRAMAALTIAMAILYGASYIGIKYSGAGLTSVLQNTDPLFVAILAGFVLGEVLQRAQWFGVGVGIVGAIVVAWQGPLWPVQVEWVSVLVVIGAISCAVGTVIGARLIGRDGNPLAIAGWQMLLAGPVLAVLSLAFEHDTGHTGPRQIAEILFIAVVGTTLPFAFLYIALTFGGASVVASWFLLVPVVGVLTAWPLLGEVPTPQVWVGTALVCTGLWFVISRASAGSVVAVVDMVPTTPISAATDGASAGGDVTDVDRRWARALAEALEDRQVTPDEFRALGEMADALGLSAARQAWIGGMFLADHVAHALEDGVITDSERRDLEQVAALLGIDAARIDGMIAAGSAQGTGLALVPIAPGTRVHFSSPLISSIDGTPISRAQAVELAEARGMVVVAAAARRCDVLVAADADVLGLTARWRRRRGARLVVERVFWRSIGVTTD